jgi:hypothetical protein
MAHRVRARARRLLRKQLPRAAYALLRVRDRPYYVRSLKRVRARDEVPHLLNARGLTGDAVEIGVKRGRYSEYVLKRWRGRRLISVDPWQEADPEEYVDHANVGQDLHERFFRETQQRLAPFGSRSEIWRTTSVEASNRVEDRTLDFVYIDARHDYESVLEDLRAWYPKLRPGGILAGHDYVDGEFPQGIFGVKSAVDEFAKELGLQVHATSAPRSVEMFPSWLIEIVPGATA